MASKQVRFFRPVVTDDKGNQVKLATDFWADAHKKVTKTPDPDRNVRLGGAPYFGEAGTALARVYPFIRVGRVRQRADWPDTLDQNFTVAPLTLSNRNLFEAGYLVPFGASNQIAYMGPMRGMVSMRAIEQWLTHMLGFTTIGHSVELVPEVDKKLLAKIQAADGVSKLSVKVKADGTFGLPNGRRSKVEQALANAVSTAEDEVDVELTFSYGRRTPTGSLRQEMLTTLRRLTRASGLERVEVGLILPDGDGFKTEQHELIEDTIAITRTWQIPDSHQVTVDEAIEQIHAAIEAFRKL